ncbi:lipopolysaccharide biosynthesis protein RfbH [bacterium]|nr:lipopolysaccharide biosynthesis protein RfbH [bacterium]
MSELSHPEQIREEILRLSRAYSRVVHARHRPGSDPEKKSCPKDPIPYAGRVFEAEEVQAAVESSLDFWLTLGSEGQSLEKELAEFLGVKHTLLVNSGSSANLLAIATLTSPKIPEKRRLRPGDEVITCAAGFPTTVAPILQNGLVPVFIDNDPVTGNARVDQLEQAYSSGTTKAVMMAHTLGNPFDLAAVLRFCRAHNLWLIEDNCDALGATYSMPLSMAKELGFTENSPGLSADGEHLTRHTGTWGDLSTQSFYPPHHITMGEGGAVNIVSHSPLKRLVESFRDWGRDCWCTSGKDNTCGKRFGWKLGMLPEGYDHKYIYSHLGYNMKPLDLQAAIGRVQLRRLPSFIKARRDNWNFLRASLDPLRDRLEFSLPTHALEWLHPSSNLSTNSLQPTYSGYRWDQTSCYSNPSWFGFMIRTSKEKAGYTGNLAKYLDSKGIGNRMLFGGNLTKQPVFSQLRKDRPEAFRVIGSLTGADDLMGRAIFVGVYPGLTKRDLEFMVTSIQEFMAGVES